MTRARALLLPFAAALALAAAAGPWAAPEPSRAAETAELVVGGNTGPASFLGASGPSVDGPAGSKGPALRLPPGAARRSALLRRLLPAPAGQASRARVVQRSHLEFASVYAEARSGLLSARSTAPPPPLPS